MSVIVFVNPCQEHSGTMFLLQHSHTLILYFWILYWKEAARMSELTDAKSVFPIIIGFVFSVWFSRFWKQYLKALSTVVTQQKGKSDDECSLYLICVLNSILHLFNLLMSADQRVGRVSSVSQISVKLQANSALWRKKNITTSYVA